MKQFIFPFVAAACIATTATAAEPGALAPFVGLGLTFGGEDLATAHYTSGPDQTVTTGGLIDLRLGLEYRLTGQPLAIQASISYHVDGANATNGDLKFSRVPVELIGLYDFGNQWRLGMGVRKATGAKVTASGDAAYSTSFGRSTNFKADLGYLLEVEYLATPQVGIQARYVNESYTIEFPGSRPKVDGSHFGVFGVFYFR